MRTVKAKAKSVTGTVVDLAGVRKVRTIRNVRRVCDGWRGEVIVNRQTRSVNRVRWSRTWHMEI